MVRSVDHLNMNKLPTIDYINVWNTNIFKNALTVSFLNEDPTL